MVNSILLFLVRADATPRLRLHGRPSPGSCLDIARETPLCGPWRALYGRQEGVARAEQRYPTGALRRRAQCRQDTRRGTMAITPFGYVETYPYCVFPSFVSHSTKSDVADRWAHGRRWREDVLMVTDGVAVDHFTSAFRTIPGRSDMSRFRWLRLRSSRIVPDAIIVTTLGFLHTADFPWVSWTFYVAKYIIFSRRGRERASLGIGWDYDVLFCRLPRFW